MELVEIKTCFAKHSGLDSQLGQSEIAQSRSHFLFPLSPVLTQVEPAGGKKFSFLPVVCLQWLGGASPSWRSCMLTLDVKTPFGRGG